MINSQHARSWLLQAHLVLETHCRFRLILYWTRLRFDRTRPFFYTGRLAMIVLLTIIHVLVCIFLIIVVLLQSGKAADLAGAFGGMGSQTAFGPRGSATLLSKATTVSAVVFMITSLSLSILATRNAGSSVGNTVLDKAKQTAPASEVEARRPVTAGRRPQRGPLRRRHRAQRRSSSPHAEVAELADALA